MTLTSIYFVFLWQLKIKLQSVMTPSMQIYLICTLGKINCSVGANAPALEECMQQSNVSNLSWNTLPLLRWSVASTMTDQGYFLLTYFQARSTALGPLEIFTGEKKRFPSRQCNFPTSPFLLHHKMPPYHILFMGKRGLLRTAWGTAEGPEWVWTTGKNQTPLKSSVASTSRCY